MAPEEELIRAGQASQVLDSIIFIEAKKRILDGIHDKMRTVPLTDANMHTKLIMLLQCWQSLEGYLDQIKQSGTIAQFQIEEEDRKRNWWQRAA